MGFKVASINWVGDNDTTFRLVSEAGGVITFELEGDCCSYSYFDSDSKKEANGLVGQTIREVRTSCVSSEPLHGEDGGRKNYMTVLKTDSGHTTLAWRNDSNGYYIGWLKLYEGEQRQDGNKERLEGFGIQVEDAW